jgi:hypothetical protein
MRSQAAEAPWRSSKVSWDEQKNHNKSKKKKKKQQELVPKMLHSVLQRCDGAYVFGYISGIGSLQPVLAGP